MTWPGRRRLTGAETARVVPPEGQVCACLRVLPRDQATRRASLGLDETRAEIEQRNVASLSPPLILET